MVKKISLLREKEDELAKIYQRRYDYYKNHHNVVLQSSEVKTYIEADTEYITAKQEKDQIKSDIEFLDKILDNLKDKYWCMKLYMDYLQFTSGER